MNDAVARLDSLTAKGLRDYVGIKAFSWHWAELFSRNNKNKCAATASCINTLHRHTQAWALGQLKKLWSNTTSLLLLIRLSFPFIVTILDSPSLILSGISLLNDQLPSSCWTHTTIQYLDESALFVLNVGFWGGRKTREIPINIRR